MTFIEIDATTPRSRKSIPTTGGIIPEQLEDDLSTVRRKVNELAQIKSAILTAFDRFQNELDERNSLNQNQLL